MQLIEFPTTDSLVLRDDYSPWISYDELSKEVGRLTKNLKSSQKGLVFLYAKNRIGSVIGSIAAQKAGHAVVLLNPDLPVTIKSNLKEIYKPQFIITISDRPPANNYGLEVVFLDQNPSIEIHRELAILLSTSGSTGSPKFVRLSYGNISSNASSIANVLELDKSDVSYGHLPLHYSYGMSIVTSHLAVGAAVSLTEKPLVDRAFWRRFHEDDITNMGGVPFHYEMMSRLNPNRLPLKNLRMLTQAGGHLSKVIKDEFHQFMSENNAKFTVMYGQTEASPRITTLSHDDYRFAPQSVGQALPGGTLKICSPDLQFLASGEDGQVVYNGPNVMMGYAIKATDLAKGDEFSGQLHTGDLGSLDVAGRLTLIGRSDRMVKLAGLRVNLDDLQKTLELHHSCVLVKHKEKLVVFYRKCGEVDVKSRLREIIESSFTLSPTLIKFHQVEDYKVTERGKIDYGAMISILDSR